MSKDNHTENAPDEEKLIPLMLAYSFITLLGVFGITSLIFFNLLDSTSTAKKVHAITLLTVSAIVIKKYVWGYERTEKITLFISASYRSFRKSIENKIKSSATLRITIGTLLTTSVIGSLYFEQSQFHSQQANLSRALQRLNFDTATLVYDTTEAFPNSMFISLHPKEADTMRQNTHFYYLTIPFERQFEDRKSVRQYVRDEYRDLLLKKQTDFKRQKYTREVSAQDVFYASVQSKGMMGISGFDELSGMLFPILVSLVFFFTFYGTGISIPTVTTGAFAIVMINASLHITSLDSAATFAQMVKL